MTGRSLTIVALAGLAAGCQGGPISSHQSMVGSLKTSVSQLEFQNDELQRQVASLKSENRRFEDRLVQERAENQELASRLGDNPSDFRTGSKSVSEDDSSVDPVAPKPRRSRSSRKPPAASIPGRIEPAREPSDDVSLAPPRPRGRLASRRTLDDRWLPVARAAAARGSIQ